MNKILLLILFSIFINAGYLVNGKISLNTENLQSTNNLFVQLWLTDKESEFFKNWNTPSIEVKISSTNQIKINQTLTNS